MKKEIINQLLECYWQGETSPEEEKKLQEFFLGNKVPEELKKYIPLFQWRKDQKSIKAALDLDLSYGKRKPVPLYSIIKIAASFLIVVTIGIGAYTHYQQEKLLNMVLNETYTNPEDAIRHTGEVVAKVSSLLQMIPQTVIDIEADTNEIDDQDIFLKDSLK